MLTSSRTSSTRTIAWATLLLASSIVPSRAHAQEASDPPWRALPLTATGEPRLMGGAAFSVGQPQGAFRRYVDAGYGGAVHGILRLGAAGAFALRIDAGGLNYGRETLRIPLNGLPGGGRVQLDLTTSNNIFWLGVGPQLMATSGLLRPYANGSIGVAYFATTSSVQGSSSLGQSFAESTNYDDTQLAYGGAVGVLVPVYRNARTLVFLDVGARYHDNGRDVRYLREGAIRDLPDGAVELDVTRSRADFATWYVGVSVGGR